MSRSRGVLLHVEDEPGMVELVREALAADGWNVLAAPTGTEGLALLASTSIQMLLLDYALPDMVGTLFLDRAAALGNALPPFVVTTGVGSEPIAVEMMKRGAADYLVKDGRFLGQIALVVRRAAHEADLARRLAQSELQLQFLAQHSPDILAITDRNGMTKYRSPAAEQLIGEALHEHVFPSERLVHPEDLGQVRAWWAAVTASAETTAHVTFRLRRGDGTVVWLEVVAQNHLDNPALNGVIMNARDVTARKRAEQDRLEMQRQLLHSQKLESLGILAGGIAHDFNNLLAVIVGNLDLASGIMTGNAEAQESVTAALKAAQRASHLTRQMLAYSGRGTFAVESVDLSTLVRENLQIFGVSVSRSIELVTDIAPNLTPILANPGQIQQVVMNLLTNASEAIGDAPGKISLGTAQSYLSPTQLSGSLAGESASPGLFACVSVADTGCGMTPAVVERLFDPFFTTKRTGRGLGMAAVLGIVRGHAGALFVESRVNQGTTIRVFFPARECTKPAVAPDAHPAVTQNQFHKRILVVDDEPSVRSTAVRLLQRLGCKTVEATDGREALAVVASDPKIDAIFMDLTMPNLGGLEATAKLQEQGRCPPIVLCSGYGDSAVGDGGPVAGTTAFLEKPFRLAELRALLERLFVQSGGSSDAGSETE